MKGNVYAINTGPSSRNSKNHKGNENPKQKQTNRLLPQGFSMLQIRLHQALQHGSHWTG
jgi:hypothetical protein